MVQLSDPVSRGVVQLASPVSRSVVQLARTRGLGPRGRQFKSGRSDLRDGTARSQVQVLSPRPDHTKTLNHTDK